MIESGMQQIDLQIRAANDAALAVTIKELAPAFERMSAQFPASQLDDSSVHLKFDYIRSRFSQIAPIRQRVLAALLPVPGPLSNCSPGFIHTQYNAIGTANLSCYSSRSSKKNVFLCS